MYTYTTYNAHQIAQFVRCTVNQSAVKNFFAHCLNFETHTHYTNTYTSSTEF